jgi:uncharacterized protein (TIGR02996 family)
MTPEDAFLIDILANPDDATPRLIYADWLDDQDDPRAAWIRRGCEVLSAPSGSSARLSLRAAFRDALYHEGHTWPELEGLVLTWDGLIGVVRYRLAEVFSWCSRHGLPFRTEQLHPEPFGRGHKPSPVGDLGAAPDSPANWAAQVQGVALRRSQGLAQQGRSPRQLAEDLGGGRLLLYLPTTARLEQPVERSGTEYLDQGHIPGWDTWLAFGRESPPDAPHQSPDGYLMAWVPPHIVTDVEQAMCDHPRRCLLWAEAFDRPFLRRLREAGLIG